MGIAKHRFKKSKGLITPSTILLLSTLILAVMLSFIYYYNFVHKLFLTRKITFENVLLVHRIIIDTCSNGYGGAEFYIFIPEGSSIVFDNDKIHFKGVDVSGLSKEYVDLILNSQSKSFRTNSIILEDEIILQFLLPDISKVTFVSTKIMSGSYIITLKCSLFTRVEVSFSRSD